MPIRSKLIISFSESPFFIIITLNLINRFAKAKFNKGTKNDFKLLVKFVLHLANNLEFLKDFI